MVKIFLTVRNRLAITTKCITALQRHSKINHHIYVYDNLTNYKVDEHFMYWSILYKKGIVQQVTFNTAESTFNAFSKVVACNQFGHLHNMDPMAHRYYFLLFIDNDIIVAPGWDQVLYQAWQETIKYGLSHVKVIGQSPGGIRAKVEFQHKIAGHRAFLGKLGGSGFWSVRSNFFKDVGYLDVKELVGRNKGHDQKYWQRLEKASGGKEYILGLVAPLAIHCGKVSGSICNSLTRDKHDMEKIKFERVEEEVNKMSFDDFYKMICKDEDLVKDW